MNNRPQLKLTAEFPVNTAVMIFSILMLAVVMSDPSSPSGMLPLILCAVVLVIYLLSSIPDLFFWYVLTEEAVEIHWRKELVAVVPWEKVHWSYDKPMLLFRTSTRDRMELWCDGVEKPQHVLPILPKLLVMNEERFLLPRADLWLAQAFLLCCPNAPEGEDVPALDKRAIRNQPGKAGTAHWFANEMLKQKDA